MTSEYMYSETSNGIRETRHFFSQAKLLDQNNSPNQARVDCYTACRWLERVGNGLSVRWVGANQAWLVMWNNQPQRVISHIPELADYVLSVLPEE